MKQCTQCGATIPSTMTIDGKRRCLKNRTRCLACSPFKALRRPLPVEEKKRKAVLKRRRWYAKVREVYGTDPRNFRGGQKKRLLITLLGGKCAICGYSKCARNLNFHHLQDKSLALTSRGFNEPLPTVLVELGKCVLLCSNCHGEVHEGLIGAKKVISQQIQVGRDLQHLSGKSWEEIVFLWAPTGVCSGKQVPTTIMA